MSYSEDKFRDHIKQMLQRSQPDSDRPLTLVELKELAESMGVGESEWNELLNKAEASLELAKNHLSVKNFLNAVESADEATSINPYIKDGNAVLAQAYYQLSVLEKNDVYLTKAGEYARRELVLDPMDSTALHVLSAVENQNSEGRFSKKLFKYLGIGGAILVLLFFVLFYCSNQASEKDVRDILQNNQVENASSKGNALYNLTQEKERIFKEAVQRRNDFLLIWFSAENSDALDAIEEYDFTQITKSETAVKIALGTTTKKAELSPDDKIRLEGFENRIAVEKKRWFESITAYNTHLQSFSDENKSLKALEFPN